MNLYRQLEALTKPFMLDFCTRTHSLYSHRYPLMSHDHHIDTHHHAHDMHDVHDMHDNGDHEHYHGHSWESHEDEAGSSKSKWKFGKLFKKNKGGHTHDHNHGHGHRGRKEGKKKFSLFG